MAVSNAARQERHRTAHPDREKARQQAKRTRNKSNHARVSARSCVGPGPHKGPVQFHHTSYSAGKGRYLCRACHLKAEGGAFD